MSNPDELVADLLAGGKCARPLELLRAFVGGYPISNLKRLLHSHRQSAVEMGASIASELGDAAAELLPEAEHLLEHPLQCVRFDMIDVVIVNATTTHPTVIARAIERVTDSDEGVRWKAMSFLADARSDLLQVGVEAVRSALLASHIRWMLAVVEAGRTVEILEALNDAEPLRRLVGASAAARVARELNELSLLEFAHGVSDPEVSSFAGSRLNVIRAAQS